MSLGQEKSERAKKSSWWWPGVVATSLAGAAVMAFRGCWHSKMSWPLRADNCSYQVCLSCGAMRLFDEENFTAYGPVRYDLPSLMQWENTTKAKSEAIRSATRSH